MECCKSLRAQIKEMNIGERIVVSLELYKWETCRYYASIIGTTENRRYTVTFKKEQFACSIKRES